MSKKTLQFRLKITLHEIDRAKKNKNLATLSLSRVKKWIAAALRANDIDVVLKNNAATPLKTLEIAVKFVTAKESATLNSYYRHKNCPTNILSFPCYEEKEITAILSHQSKADAITLGDLAICLPIVKQEAREQHKDCLAHLAHLIIHGALHLVGHTHATTRRAKAMETREIAALEKSGYENPY